MAGTQDSREDEEDEFVNREVNAEFEAHALSSEDFDGIEKLLRRRFLNAAVSVAELTAVLIQQNHIGSVIKQTDVPGESDEEDGEEEEILGFTSLCENREQSGVEQRDNKPVGFLLSKRFLNVPPQIGLPMHQQFPKELQEAGQANQPCGKCCYYLIIRNTFRGGLQECQKQRECVPQKEELTFANAEEEFFYEKALLKFSYSVQEESDLALGGGLSLDDQPTKPLQTVMLIPASKMG